MANVNGRSVPLLCCMATCIAASPQLAEGAIARRNPVWNAQAGGDGLTHCVPSPGIASPGSMALDVVVEPFRHLETVAVPSGVDAVKWRVSDAVCVGSGFMLRSGDSRLMWGGCDVSASASDGALMDITWQDMPGRGVQVGHAPAAGPLVLLGVAAIVGGPRRPRAARTPIAVGTA